MCPPGWFLRLKPNGSVLNSQTGACYVLKILKLPFVRSDRYQQAWKEEFDRLRAAEKTRKSLQAETFAPVISNLAVRFQKFARFLKKRASDIDQLAEPASESDIRTLEEGLGISLPMVVIQFFKCTKSLRLDGLSLGLDQVFQHPASIDEQHSATKAICIAEYWLEADGDQVLLESTSRPADDPPVFYYAHSGGKIKVRKLASSFSAWIESLPRSPVFRDH